MVKKWLLKEESIVLKLGRKSLQHLEAFLVPRKQVYQTVYCTKFGVQ